MAVSTAVRPRTAVNSATARRWLKANLFSNTLNTVLTVVTLGFLVFATYQLAKFVLVDAEWTVINANRRLLAIGRFM